MDTLPSGRADIHMHTRASDGMATARQVLDYVARRGHLDVIAITDHDMLDASLWAYEQRAWYPFDVIPGVEITAVEGHVLGLWVTQPIPKKMSVVETAAAIHEQGGIAILAHPGEILIAGRYFLRYLRQPQVLLSWGIDGVEVFNAGTMTPGNNRIARKLGSQLPLPVVGNSDAHTLSAIGCGRTRFPGRSAADFRLALARRQTAAEGASWPITDYLKLSPSSIRRKLNASLETSMRLTHLNRFPAWPRSNE
ncbi:MAG: phosphotransferase [Chloroflexota bacterium]|nr:phosphotransferase [Anaerolineae bacterium CFX8]GIL12894.1 MAG: phosphotransferase [Chloroflexota bacterium]